MADEKLQSRKHFHKLYLTILAVVALALIGTALAFTISKMSNTKAVLLQRAQGFCERQILSTTERLHDWANDTRMITDGFSDSNLFRVFVSDYALSREGLDKLKAVIADPQSQEYEIVRYLHDLLHDFTVERGYRSVGLVLPDGRPLLGKPAPVDQQQLACVKSFSVLSFHSDKQAVTARLAAPVFPMDNETKPGAFLVLEVPLGDAFAKNFMGAFDAAVLDGKMAVTLHGNDLALDPEPVPAKGLETGRFVESPASPYSLYKPIDGAYHGYVRVSMPAATLEGRVAAAQRDILRFFAGTVLVIFLLTLALFMRETMAMERSLNRRIKDQSSLLNSINVSVDMAILLMDRDGTVRYSNHFLDQEAGRQQWEDEKLTDVFPPEQAGQIVARAAQVLDTNQSASMEIETGEGDAKLLFRVSIYPSETEKTGRTTRSSVLMCKDITVFRKRAIEQKRRIDSLLDVFASAIESVDKGFAGHTKKMLAILNFMERDNNVEQEALETLRIACRIQGINKLFIPRDILLKEGKLTDEERERIRQAQKMAGEMLRNFDFRLPVADTIQQSGERMDGTGRPKGLKGDQIMRTARIFSIINAFCAMISPRKYRAAMTPAEALSELGRDNGYDQSIVAALARLNLADLRTLTDMDKN